jgi:hypothetical protein
VESANVVQTPRNVALILIVDGNSRRRGQIRDAFAPMRVIETMSLHDAYSLLEDLQPGTVLLSETAARESGLPMFVRFLQVTGARWLFYGVPQAQGQEGENGSCSPGNWVPMPPEGGAAQLVAAVRRMTALTSDPGSRCPQDSGKAGACASTRGQVGAQVHAAPPPRSGGTLSGPGWRPDLIVIGASTGGIKAIESLLAEFPADCPPTLIVQHIRPGFIDGMIRRLAGNCRMRVSAARHGTQIQRCVWSRQPRPACIVLR